MAGMARYGASSAAAAATGPSVGVAPPTVQGARRDVYALLDGALGRETGIDGKVAAATIVPDKAEEDKYSRKDKSLGVLCEK